MQRVLVALCLAGQCTALVPNGVTARSNGKAPLKVLNCVQNRILRARRRGGSAAAAAQRHAVASMVENETSNKSTAFRPSSAPPPRPDTTHPPRNNTKTQAATLERVAPTAPIFSDVCSETGVTLSRFMIETALANPELSELESIFSSIETASKTISNLVRRSSLTGLTGYLDSGNINIQGEEQKKLDVITNDVLKNALRYTGRMGVLASEEEDAPVEVDDDIEEKYQKEVLVEKTRGEFEDDGAFASTLETRMCLCCCARVPSPWKPVELHASGRRSREAPELRRRETNARNEPRPQASKSPSSTPRTARPTSTRASPRARSSASSRTSRTSATSPPTTSTRASRRRSSRATRWWRRATCSTRARRTSS